VNIDMWKVIELRARRRERNKTLIGILLCTLLTAAIIVAAIAIARAQNLQRYEIPKASKDLKLDLIPKSPNYNSPEWKREEEHKKKMDDRLNDLLKKGICKGC